MRDNRGKRHNLAFVLTSLLWALLRSGGNLTVSKLHRWMVREHQTMADQTGHLSQRTISHGQLRRLLANLDYQTYNHINAEFFGWLNDQQGIWQSVDGKELRGSIDGVKGQKRGQTVVRLVGHEDAQASIIGFYEGDKESERTLVEIYFKAQSAGSLAERRFSLDALFTTPTLLTHLHKQGAGYVVGLKANQQQLLSQAEQLTLSRATFSYAHYQKGHGRVEPRSYQGYELVSWLIEDRWQPTGLQTLLVVNRSRCRLKDGQQSQERTYYVSNLGLAELGGLELAGAIRNHWQIEADHYVRDKTGGEDALRCSHPTRLRSVSSVLNVGINLLRASDRGGNLRAYWEDCSADRHQALACWKAG